MPRSEATRFLARAGHLGAALPKFSATFPDAPGARAWLCNQTGVAADGSHAEQLRLEGFVELDAAIYGVGYMIIDVCEVQPGDAYPILVPLYLAAEADPQRP